MITIESIIEDVRDFITKDGDLGKDAYSNDELKAYIKEAAVEIMGLRKHLLIDEDGNPRKMSEVVTEEAIDVPASYKGALFHGCLMLLFAQDQSRSIYERGLFQAQLAMGGRK